MLSLFLFPLRKSNAEAIFITVQSHPYLCEEGLIFNPGGSGGDMEKENKEERSECSGTFITTASHQVYFFTLLITNTSFASYVVLLGIMSYRS